ncbi:MAG: hypothetical protein JW790_04175 [Dehalococcoidales bacterium]|nr:hypothetical protein [Dehalococcoidales bacterium]
MNRFKGARYLLCLALLLGLCGGLLGGPIVLAAQGSSQAAIMPPPPQDEEPLPEEPVEESLKIYSSYPMLQSTVGSVFEFEITLFYTGGSEPRTFDLDLTAPEGWTGIFLGGYPETEISAFTVEPNKKRETVTLIVGATSEDAAVEGDYVFTVQAASGDISGSTDLEAVVVSAPPQYLLYLSTATLIREFQIKAGQETHVSMQLTNSYTGTVNNINFSAEGPEGWNVTFTPDSLTSLEPGVTQEIDMVINPPAGTEAGDYPLNVGAIGDESETIRELRITVVATTIWGQAGIGIAVAIIVVLAIWFRRAGRREEAAEAASTTTGATKSGNWFKRTVSRLRKDVPGK